MSSLSQIKRISLALTLLLVLSFVSLWAQFPQGFEGTTTMPTGWTVYNQDADTYGFEVYAANANAHSGTNVARVHWNSTQNNDWLVTPALAITNDNKVIKFWARSNSTVFFEDFNVKLSTTTNAVASFTVNLGTYTQIANEWTEYTYDLSAYVGQTVYVGVQCVSVNELYFSVDDFDWVLGNDLMGLSVTGNTAPTVNTQTPYIVTVKNNGGNAQSNYTVKLYKQGDVELGSMPGTQVAAGATAQFSFNWTPTVVENTSLYGKVILTGDNNAANDQTAPLAIAVQPAGVVAVNVGNPATTTTTNLFPADFYYKNSLSQSIYMASEINAGGLITSLKYYMTLLGDIPANTPLKVWMANTALSAFEGTAGWIPASQFTLVFDGPVTLTSTGAFEFTLPLTSPFPYGGGNLCIMVERPMDANYYGSGNVFKATETPDFPNRTIHFHSDTVDADPTAPPTGTLIAAIPNTSFLINTAGLSTLTGTVTSNSTPVEGVKVAVDNTVRFALTNAQGQYTMQYLQPGTVSLTASKHGYVNGTSAGVVLTADGSTTQNMTVTPLPTVVVSGQVNGSDNGLGIANATVKLIGYENYEVTTNASGAFSFPTVFANNTYQIKVNAAGYQNYTGEVVVAAANVTVPAITVNELANPARNVVATANATAANLIWKKPSTSAEVEFRYDDGTAVGQLGAGSGTTTTVLGAAHRHSATINSVSWMLTAEGGPHATVDVYVIGMTDGTPDNTQILFHGVDIPNTDAEWNNLVLTTPAEAPNGFLIGVAYNGFLALGMDDGLGEDYPFTNNTQYASMDVTSEGFSAIETLGAFAGNFTIRAMGADNGALTAPLALAPVSFKDAAASKAIHANRLTHSTLVNPIVTNFSTLTSTNNRALIGYQIYRTLVANVGNENLWTTIGSTPTANDTTYTDNTWAQAESGVYKYAVKAKYTNNVLSNAAFSNEVARNMTSNVTINLATANGLPVAGANVRLTCNDGVPEHIYTATATGSSVNFPTVWKGVYQIRVALAGYATHIQDGVSITTDTYSHPVITLQVSNVVFADNFEDHESFALTFGDWNLVDVDQSTTYGFSGITFPNSGSPMAYICFVPSETQAPLDTPMLDGSLKMAACFASTTPPNNDWMITPRFTASAASTVKFWARSYTDQYGLERFKVGVSTNANPTPDNMTIITAGDYVEAPVEWTEYTYSLASYAGQQIAVSVNCLSNDAFIFFVDDFEITGNAVDHSTPVAKATSLKGNYPNPFNPVTTISFDIAQEGHVSLDIFNVKGQKVKTLVNDRMTAGSHTIQWNGTDDNNKKVGSGIYFYNMKSGKYTNTRKMILMK